MFDTYVKFIHWNLILFIYWHWVLSLFSRFYFSHLDVHRMHQLMKHWKWCEFQFNESRTNIDENNENENESWSEAYTNDTIWITMNISFSIEWACECVHLKSICRYVRALIFYMMLIGFFTSFFFFNEKVKHLIKGFR